MQPTLKFSDFEPSKTEEKATSKYRTHIVWEDVGNSTRDIFKKSILANLVITVLLLGAFFFFFFLRLVPISV